MKKLIFFLIIILIIINPVDAKHGDEFLEKLVNTLNETCFGKSLEIKEGLIYSELKEESVTIIEKEGWDYESLKKIITLLDGDFNYAMYSKIPCDEGPLTMTKSGNDVEGCNLFKCGSHTLDISGDDYYLDDIKFELAGQITKNVTEKNIIKIGTLNFTLIEFSFAVFSISIVFITIAFKIFLSIKKEFHFSFLKKTYYFKVENSKK